jgi:hypothetical protein
VHHSGEDELVYPLLEERCKNDLAVIQRVDAQHKYLDEPMDAGRAAIASWRSEPSPEGAQAVIDALSSIVETLRPHLSDEEVYVVPLCTTWISPDEWARLPGHAIMSFRADKPFLALGLIYEQLDVERREKMLARMPPEFRAMVTELWLPAFDAFIAEVRRSRATDNKDHSAFSLGRTKRARLVRRRTRSMRAHLHVLEDAIAVLFDSVDVYLLRSRMCRLSHAVGGRPRWGRGPAFLGMRPASVSARRSSISM